MCGQFRSFMRAVISPLCRVTNPAPLLHHEPLAFIVREIELPRGFGRPLIRRLDVAAILQPRTQDRHALGAELVGGGGLLWAHLFRRSRHGRYRADGGFGCSLVRCLTSQWAEPRRAHF